MRRTALFCIIAASFLLAVIYDSYAAFLTAASVTAAPLLSAAAAWGCRLFLRPRIEFPSQADREIPVPVTVKLPGSAFMIPFDFQIQTDDQSLYKLIPSGRGSWQLSYTVMHCGAFRKPGIIIFWNDIFGLFRFSKRISSPGQILVFPRLLTDIQSASQKSDVFYPLSKQIMKEAVTCTVLGRNCGMSTGKQVPVMMICICGGLLFQRTASFLLSLCLTRRRTAILHGTAGIHWAVLLLHPVIASRCLFLIHPRGNRRFLSGICILSVSYCPACCRNRILF